MKIGIINGAYKNPDGTKDYAKFKRHGFDCLDAGEMGNIKGEYYQMTEDELKKALTEERKKVLDAGLEYSQAHGPWPVDDSTPESRKEKMKYIKRSILGASFLQAKYLVVHPTRIYDENWKEYPDMLDQNAEIYRELCEYGANLGVGVCIENMPFGPNFSLSTVKQVLNFVETYKIPNLSICYDTGHAWLYGEKPADMVRLCGKHLTTLHVHDTDGVQDRHWLPFSGSIDWNGFGKALHEIGFDNALSIETCARDYTRYPAELLEYYEIGLAKIAKALTEI
ncbi:MAG: sugar phosphate isomerase/epimerase [Ruminococcaceae bacterium]|nr:sugar phosphate isomerase/epimerase [Oscillospiraceae bacterium]